MDVFIVLTTGRRRVESVTINVGLIESITKRENELTSIKMASGELHAADISVEQLHTLFKRAKMAVVDLTTTDDGRAPESLPVADNTAPSTVPAPRAPLIGLAHDAGKAPAPPVPVSTPTPTPTPGKSDPGKS